MFLSKRKFNELVLKVDAISSKVGISMPVALAEDVKKGRDVACALNHCIVSVSQIVDYNDIYILEQEYEAILNNLNLEEFPDDEIFLDILKQILDTITFFRIQEGDKRFIEKEYQHRMKNAVWGVLPNPSVILAGGHPAVMAVALVTQIGVGYMNYRKKRSDYMLEKEKQEWELQRSAINQFNALRRDLFETAWRLTKEYKFKDNLRLTEKQISHYNTILMDSIALRRYERLDSIAKDFEAFPPFWYHKGNAARDIFAKCVFGEDSGKYKDYALHDFRKFNEMHLPFMREDIIAASCAMEHISLLDVNDDRQEIIDLLKKAVSLAGRNFDILQMCVFVYSAVGELGQAADVLQRLVNEDYNIEMNAPLLSRIYCKYESDRKKYNILSKRVGDTNVLPWDESNSEEDVWAQYRLNKEKYGEREKQIVRGFELFLDEYLSENISDFINVYEGEDSLIDKIIFYRDKDLYGIVIKNLEKVFFELNDKFSGIFNNDSNTWKELLSSIASGASTKLNKFKLSDKEVRDFISERSRGKGRQPRLHFHRKNNPENQEVCDKIELIFGEMKDVYSCIFEEVKLRFKHSISMKIMDEHGDDIKQIITRWYNEYNRTPPTIESVYEVALNNNSKLFFSND